MNVRIHAVDPRSRANGPGVRFVVWLQGCTLGCPGCFNPATYAESGPETPIVEIAGRAHCRTCGNWSTVDDYLAPCTCGSADLDYASGEELRIRHMEVQ